MRYRRIRRPPGFAAARRRSPGRRRAADPGARRARCPARRWPPTGRARRRYRSRARGSTAVPVRLWTRPSPAETHLSHSDRSGPRPRGPADSQPRRKRLWHRWIHGSFRSAQGRYDPAVPVRPGARPRGTRMSSDRRRRDRRGRVHPETRSRKSSSRPVAGQPGASRPDQLRTPGPGSGIGTRSGAPLPVCGGSGRGGSRAHPLPAISPSVEPFA